MFGALFLQRRFLYRIKQDLSSIIGVDVFSST